MGRALTAVELRGGRGCGSRAGAFPAVPMWRLAPWRVWGTVPNPPLATGGVRDEEALRSAVCQDPEDALPRRFSAAGREETAVADPRRAERRRAVMELTRAQLTSPPVELPDPLAENRA